MLRFLLLVLLQILLILGLILVELLLVFQILLVISGGIIMLSLCIVVVRQVLQILLMGCLVLRLVGQVICVGFLRLLMLRQSRFICIPIFQILRKSLIVLCLCGQILLISSGIFGVLCQSLFIGFHSGLVFSLCLLVSSLLLLVGFPYQPVVFLDGGIVIFDIFVVAVHGLVVITDFFVVTANDLIVLLGIGAVGVGQLRGIGKLQLGVGQQTVGVFLVLFGSGSIILLDLLVLFGGLAVLSSGIRIGPVDLCIGFGRSQRGGNGIADFGIRRRNIHPQRIDLGDFSSLRLSGQSQGHCNSDCSCAASLGQVLHIILLSHNFFSSR